MLDKIDIAKIDSKLKEVKERITEIKKLEEQEKELQKIREVVTEYNHLKSLKNMALFTQQSERRLLIMEKFPYFSLCKGIDGISTFEASYDHIESLEKFGREKESNYKSGVWAAEMKDVLKELQTKKSKKA